MGPDNQPVLMASDAGYGFITALSDLHTKNKAGKAALSLPKGAKVMTPQLIGNVETSILAAISNEGRLLTFSLSELPQLARGKGNKILSIPSARVQSREEFMLVALVVGEGQSIVIQSGKRTLTLKPKDLEHYRGERGRRGNKLPRGFQKVDGAWVD